ncbi:MAG: competence/damage-inducible protein A [Bacillota bacterium]
MQAEIISIGTELLLGEITDTNAQYLSSRLRDIGVNVYRRITVGDNPGRLLSAFEESISRADIIIATGGLGPTEDDLTAHCLASALKRTLVFDETAWASIEEWFTKRRRLSDISDKKQAYIVSGGFFIHNPAGTAPGQGVLFDGKLAVLLPGPPFEMKPMFETYVIPLIRQHFNDLVPIHYVNLNVVGLPESKVAEAVKDLMASENPSLAPYTGTGQVRLRIAARGHNEAETMGLISTMEKEVRRRLGHHIYGKNDDTLEEAIGKLLRRKGLTLAVAESVTGGLVSHRITEVPGSSKYFKMGMVAYDSGIKMSQLGIPPEAVHKDQAVNQEVAMSMAESIRLLAGADLGLATTGFAGPDGGTPDEPVGTVYIGISSKKGTSVDKIVHPSSRSRTKAYAAQRALYTLYRFLTEHRT